MIIVRNYASWSVTYLVSREGPLYTEAMRSPVNNLIEK